MIYGDIALLLMSGTSLEERQRRVIQAGMEPKAPLQRQIFHVQDSFPHHGNPKMAICGYLEE
jgi:hypothetical protein